MTARILIICGDALTGISKEQLLKLAEKLQGVEAVPPGPVEFKVAEMPRLRDAPLNDDRALWKRNQRMHNYRGKR